MAAAERARMLWKLADLITANVDEMARLESVNTGKTLFDSGKVELPFAAEVFRYYAGWTTKIHGETLNLRDGAFTFTLRQPLGVVGAIVPWNFPFLLASWKIAPRCRPVTRSFEAAPSRLKFAELTQEAGPEGVFGAVPSAKAA
jgi:acyl-CoA reductase-like NAD-dependent aldehyde dehydrogenase